MIRIFCEVAFCSGENGPAPRWWHMFKLPNPETSTTLRVHSEASATFSLSGAILHPEDIFNLKSHSATLRPLPRPLRAFSTPRPSLSRRLQLRTWSFNTISSLISADNMQLHPPHVHNVKCPYQCEQLWTVADFSCIYSQIISVGDHDRYNKFSTCRSCSYNNPSILHPHQHFCQVQMRPFSNEKVVASWTFGAHNTPH